MWVTIVTELWNHKNKVVFNRRIIDAKEIFTLMQLKDLFWMKHKFKENTFSYSDWYFSPIKCMESLV